MESNRTEEVGNFLKDKGIKYYDVQMELVDHFMVSIEQSELNFKEALDEVYKSFNGKKGLKNIVKQKKELLFHKFLKMYFEAYKAYFSLPRILLTIIIFTISYFLVHTFGSHRGVYNLIAQLFNFSIILQTSFKFGVFRESYKKNDKFLILVIQEYFQLILIIPVTIIMLYSFDFSNSWSEFVVVVAITMATIGVLSYNSIRKYLASQMELYYTNAIA